jgi:hypothetical protein
MTANASSFQNRTTLLLGRLGLGLPPTHASLACPAATLVTSARGALHGVTLRWLLKSQVRAWMMRGSSVLQCCLLLARSAVLRLHNAHACTAALPAAGVDVTKLSHGCALSTQMHDASGAHADYARGSTEVSMPRHTEEIINLLGGMKLLEPPSVSGPHSRVRLCTRRARRSRS